MSRRVVITGLGIVCPIGNNPEEVWNSVKEGKCGIGPITYYDPSEQRDQKSGYGRLCGQAGGTQTG